MNNLGEKKQMRYILQKAFKEVSRELKPNTGKTIDATCLDKQDALSHTALKLTEKIENGEKSLNNFEFKNVTNMKIFLKGAIKKGLLNVKQETENYVLSYETITTIDNEIVKFENEKAFNQIMDYKNSKGKDVFTIAEKELFKCHYMDDMKNGEIAKKLNFNLNTVGYHLKIMHQKLLKLPIRELYDTRFVFAEPKTKYSFRPANDILTNFAPLKRYRRTKKIIDLEKYKENSSYALQCHFKRGVNASIKPVPLENYKPVKRKKPKYDKTRFPFTLASKTYGEKIPLNTWIKASDRAGSFYMIKTEYYLEKPETIASIDQRKMTYRKTDKLDRLINKVYFNLITQCDLRYQAYLNRLIAYRKDLEDLTAQTGFKT